MYALLFINQTVDKSLLLGQLHPGDYSVEYWLDAGQLQLFQQFSKLKIYIYSLLLMYTFLLK